MPSKKIVLREFIKKIVPNNLCFLVYLYFQLYLKIYYNREPKLTKFNHFRSSRVWGISKNYGARYSKKTKIGREVKMPSDGVFADRRLPPAINGLDLFISASFASPPQPTQTNPCPLCRHRKSQHHLPCQSTLK